jgi:hypothetical protein
MEPFKATQESNPGRGVASYHLQIKDDAGVKHG